MILVGVITGRHSERFDFQAPIANSWELKRVWPRAEFVIFDDAGHAADDPSLRELVKASDRFAVLP